MTTSTLAGRAVVVTGCTRGFGRVLVTMLAQRGAALAVSGPWLEESESLAAELAREYGVRTMAAPGDVTDPDQVEELAATVERELGPLAVWVNNAATATPVGRAFDLAPAEFEASVRVNVLGSYYGARAAAARMLPRGEGAIVMMLGRGDDVRATPAMSPYGASKAWVRGFTRTLQAEYRGSGVRVVGFNPGMMLTDMLLAPTVVGDAGERAMRPFGTITRVFGDPPEVAAARLVAALESRSPPRSIRLLGPRGVVRHAGRAAVRRVRGQWDDGPAPTPTRIDP